MAQIGRPAGGHLRLSESKQELVLGLPSVSRLSKSFKSFQIYQINILNDLNAICKISRPTGRPFYPAGAIMLYDFHAKRAIFFRWEPPQRSRGVTCHARLPKH